MAEEEVERVRWGKGRSKLVDVRGLLHKELLIFAQWTQMNPVFTAEAQRTQREFSFQMAGDTAI
jgi:hypothetical protein